MPNGETSMEEGGSLQYGRFFILFYSSAWTSSPVDVRTLKIWRAASLFSIVFVLPWEP